MRISNDTLVQPSADLSVNWTSEPIWLGHLADYSIQLYFSGVPAGVFRLQCSNDKETNVETGAGVETWTLVAGSTQVIEESGDHTWSVANAAYRWVRVQWLAGIGSTGLLTHARINGKGI